MRPGIFISVALHAAILLWGMLVFTPVLPDFEDTLTEELPIEIVPLGDEMSIKEGDKTAPVKEKSAPKPSTKPEEKPDGKIVGDGTVDTHAPFKPKEKPREVESAPPLAGEPEPKPDITPPEDKPAPAPEPEAKPAPKPAPEPEPKPAPKPEPVAAPEEKPQEDAPAPIEDSIEDILRPEEPKPEEPKPEPVKAEEPKPEEPKPDPVPVLPTNVPLPTAKPKKPAAPKVGDKAEAVNAPESAMIDRTRTQGGGARRSQDPAGFGASRNIGNGDQMSQTIGNIIGSCVQRNWNLAALSGASAYDLRIQVHLRLNRDGSISGDPELIPAGGDISQRTIITTQARAALTMCSPFSNLPPDRYDLWHDVTINMKAFPD